MEDRGGAWREQAAVKEDEAARDAGERPGEEAAEGGDEEGAAEWEASLPPELEVEWSFIDCDMETVSLHNLPSGLIASNLPLAVFGAEGPCRVSERAAGHLRRVGRGGGRSWGGRRAQRKAAAAPQSETRVARSGLCNSEWPQHGRLLRDCANRKD